MEDIQKLLLTYWGVKGNVKDISKEGLSGSFIYAVSTNDSKYILKGYPEKITEDNISKVHELLLSFEKQNFNNVPRVIRLKDSDKSAVLYKNRNWEVLTFVDGEHLKEDVDTDGLKSIAETIANFHKCSLNVKFDEKARVQKPLNKSKFIEDSDFLKSLDKEQIEKLKKENIYDLFEEFQAKSKEAYSKFIDIDWSSFEGDLPKSFIHSDLTKKNIFFKNNKVSSLIDFESTKFGPRIVDIARIPIEFTDCSKESIISYIKSYDSINKLTELERSYLLNWMVALNIWVNSWAMKHFINFHLDQKGDNKTYLINRIEKALKVQSNLLNFSELL